MQVGQLSWDATIQDSEFQAQINRIEQGLISLTDTAKKSGDELEDVFKRAAIAATSYFSVQQTANFIRSIIETRGEFQQLEIAFTTMLRSKEKADQLMKDVVEFAATTPFDLKQVASGTKQLLAYGFAAGDMKENLSMLGNVASGVGSQINDLIYLYGTLKASGRVTQMDINQFAGRGIPIYEELSKVLKVNVDQVREFVSAGKVGFQDIEQSFKNMTAESGMFYNLMQEQSKSLTGQIANLQDAWESMLNEMGESQEGLLSKSIEGVAYLVENYQKILDIIKLLIASYGVYRAALIVNTLALSGMSAMELLHYGRLVVVQRAQALLNTTILANPYVAAGAALAILVATLYTFRNNASAAEIAQSKLNDVLHQSNLAVVDETVKLNDLIAVAKDEARSKAEREKAIRHINAISPEYLGNISLETIGTNQATEAIEGYIAALKKRAFEEAAYNERVSIAKERLEVEQGGGVSWSQKALAWYMEMSGGDNNKQLAKGIYENAKQEQLKLLDAREKGIDDALKEYDTKGKNTTPVVDPIQNKKYWEDKKTEAQTALDALSIIEAKGQKGKYLLKKIAEFDEKIAAYSNKKVKGSKAENSLLSLLKDIADAERKALQSGLEKEDSELDRINERYDNLEKRAKELGLNSAAFTRIDNARKTETGNEKQKQEIDEYKKTIDRQKEIFDAFEDHKVRIGEERSRQIYSAEIGEFDNYIDYLKAELKKLEGDKGIGASLKRTNLAEILVKAETEEAKKQSETYVKIIEQAQTYTQKILKIESDFKDAISKVKGKISSDELAVLTKNKDDEINAIKNAELQKLKIYQKANEQVLLVTREQVKEQIKALRSLLDNGDITDELRTKLKGKLENLEAKLKLGIDESNIKELERRLKETKDAIKEIKLKNLSTPENEKELERLRQRLIEIQVEINGINSSKLSKFFDYLKGDAATVAQGLSNDLYDLSGSFYDLSDALGGVDTEVGYTLDTIGRLVEVGSDAAGAFASFASGDIVGGVTKTIKAVSGLFSIGKKVKEMNAAARKEVEDYYTNATKGEKAYQDALKARELQLIKNNKTVLEGIRAEMALRNEMNQDASKEADEIMRKLSGMDYVTGQSYKHGTWFRKAKVTKSYESLRGKDFEQLSLLLNQGKLEGEAKAMVERLVELEQQGFDSSQAIKELNEDLRELFTGTSADTIGSGFLAMLKEGKTDVKDFADFFENTMKDAALSIFKSKVLDSAMADFYDKFAESAMSGDALTEKEIKDLKILFDSITDGVTAQFENLEKITGLTFDKVKKEINASFSNMADDIVSAFVKGFEGIDEVFEDTIKKALLNSFKTDVIEKELEAFHDLYAEMIAENGKLDEGQIELLRVKYDLIISQGKEKFDELQKLTGVALTEIEEIDKNLREKLTGSTLDGITDSIVNMFAEGKTAGEDFANNFEDLMKKAILNIFRTQSLAKELESFYDSFASYAEKGEQLSAADIAALRVEYDKMMAGAENRFKELQAITGIVFEVKEEVQKIVEIAKDTIVGITFESFADGIVDLLSRGTASVQDFADNFEQVMRNAILNTFKTKTLAREMEAFYDEFYRVTAQGGLTDQKLDQLKVMYDAMIKKGREEMDKLSQITGVDLSTSASSSAGMSGMIRAGITEETGTKIDGIMRSQFEVSKSLLLLQEKQWAIANNFNRIGIERLTAIQKNTLRTADNTQRLENIENHLAKLAGANGGIYSGRTF